MQGRPDTITAGVDDLVEAARQVERPSSDVRDRVHRKLSQRIATGAAASAVAVALASEVAAAIAVGTGAAAAGTGAAAGSAVGGAAAGSAVGGAAAGSAVGGAAVASNAAVGLGAGTATSWWTAGVAKLVAASLIAGGGAVAGGAYWAAHRRASTAPAERAAVVVHLPESNDAEAALGRPSLSGPAENLAAQEERSAAAAPVDPNRPDEPAPALRSPPRTQGSNAPPGRAATGPQASGHATERPDRLPEELAVLRSAQRNLDSGQLAAAKNDLRRYAEHFPAGRLRAEYHALRILTLCAEGDRSGAEAEIQRLKRTNPDSPMLRRLRQGCPQP